MKSEQLLRISRISRIDPERLCGNGCTIIGPYVMSEVQALQRAYMEVTEERMAVIATLDDRQLHCMALPIIPVQFITVEISTNED